MQRFFEEPYQFDLLEDLRFECVDSMNKYIPEEKTEALWSDSLTYCICVGLKQHENMVLYHSVGEHGEKDIPEIIAEYHRKLSQKMQFHPNFVETLYQFLKNHPSTADIVVYVGYHPAFSINIQSDIEKIYHCLNYCIKVLNAENNAHLTRLDPVDCKVIPTKDGYFYFNQDNDAGDLQKALKTSIDTLLKSLNGTEGGIALKLKFLMLIQQQTKNNDAPITKMKRVITQLKEIAQNKYQLSQFKNAEEERLLSHIIAWDIFANAPSPQLLQKWCAKTGSNPQLPPPSKP